MFKTTNKGVVFFIFQEDISLKKFDLRVAQIHLSAVKAQVSDFLKIKVIFITCKLVKMIYVVNITIMYHCSLIYLYGHFSEVHQKQT